VPPRPPRSEPRDAPPADPPPCVVPAPIKPPGRKSPLPRLPCVQALGPPQGAPQVGVVFQNLGARATPFPQPLAPLLCGFLAAFPELLQTLTLSARPRAAFLTLILRAFATAILQPLGRISRVILAPLLAPLLAALLALLLRSPLLALLLRTALTKLFLPLLDAPLLPLLLLAALLDRPLPALTSTLLRP
jgi:hypothetical protein